MSLEIIVYPALLSGLDPDAVPLVSADKNGDSCPNDGTTFLLYELDAAATGDVTVTVDSIRPCSHGEDHDSITLVPDEKRRIIGPFDRGRFNDPSGNLVISYTGADADILLLKVKAVTVKPTLI